MDTTVSNRTELQPAFVLHTRLYRETSLLVDFLTQDQGRLSVIARGARRPKSPYRGLVAPFIPLLVSYLGGGELKTLIQAEPQGPGLSLSGERLVSGLYLNELCVRLVPVQIPVPELFETYGKTVELIAQGEPLAPVLRVFEKQLLSSLGHDLCLSHDTDQQPIVAEDHYLYDLERGPYRVSPESVPAQMSGLIHGQTLLDLAAEKLTSPLACSQAKSLLQSMINALLGGKPVLSKQLLQTSKGRA
jgi:DNA repair protein RecO (recombination protein O)